MNPEQVIASFHEVLALKARAVCASIDAANCQTARDWRSSHEAADALSEATDRFEALLAALSESPALFGRADLVRYSTSDATSVVKAIDAIRDEQPARAIAHLAKVAEGREQFANAREQQRRTWEANAIAQVAAKK